MSVGVAAPESAASALFKLVRSFVHCSGAIGFTHDHDLHVWSMRLQALKLEMTGVTGHRRAVAQERWQAAR